jgi:hypothetical protein
VFRAKLGEGDFEKMKKLVLVLTGIMALVFFVSTASATPIWVACGGVGSFTGTTTFNGGVTSGASVLSGGTATITCASTTVPVGDVLTGIDLYLKNDGSAPSSTTSGVNFSWNSASGVSFGTEMIGIASTDGINFNECTGNSGPFVGTCPAILSFSESIAAGGSSPVITVTVSDAAVNGGVSSVGNANANLYINFDESSAAPEPATFGLIGGALLGLGLLGRKRFLSR